MANQLVDQYENLPGVKVEYENGNLYSNHENLQANTKSILVIGTAIDGPVGQPVSVQAVGGPKAAEKLFGGMMKAEEIETGAMHPDTGEPLTKTVKVPHEGTLIRTMYELLEQGNEDVRLLRIDGRRAKTELEAQDLAQSLEQILGMGAGNVSFLKDISISGGGRLTSSPISNIREKKVDGTIVNEYSGSELDRVVLNVDTDSGSETVYFEANVFRPGHQIEVTYNLNERTYEEVLRSDADGALTQSGADNRLFTSAHGFWSDDILAGHTINVYVNGTAIPQINSSGEFLWRPGTNSYNIVDELTSTYSTQEYRDGGIRFTSAYNRGVTDGTYPALTGVSVAADYYYYTETAMTDVETYDVPGSDSAFVLDYVPQSDDFNVYYELGGVKFELEPKTTENPDGDYTMVYPSPGTTDPAEVILKAGAVPVGVKLRASYKTFESKKENPFVIVEGLHSGEAYGTLKNMYDVNSLEGVTVEVVEDITADDPTGREKIIYFTKPSNKQLTSRDKELVYRTRELRGVRTIRDFANYVNNDANNNIVRLSVSSGVDVAIQGLLPTRRPVHLGEYKNRDTNLYELMVDETKPAASIDRFPWLGHNGFFNRNDMASMLDLYEKLGGKYEVIAGAVDEYKLVRRGIYNNIENYKVDEIFLAEAMNNTPIGMVSQSSYTGEETIVADPSKSFGTQLAQHCAVTTAKSHETIGFIGMEPVKNATLFDIQEYVEEVTQPGQNDHFMINEASGELILNDEGEPIDIGHHLNVVFGPEVGLSNYKLGSYVTSGAGIYSALRTTLPIEYATTNKAIAVNGLRYALSEAQHNQLAGAHYVTFEEKTALNGTREFKVKDGVTASQKNSDYQRESTVSIVHSTVQIIRSISEPFIGLPNGLAQRNSLATEIQAGLDKLKERGVLQDFEFSIFTSQREKVLGNAFITLKLVPQFETRKIFTSVGLRQSL